MLTNVFLFKFLLGVLKFATRDPLGMGIEYEGGKPGWNDAMNGLVGMLGSGMPETFELKVLLAYIQKVSSRYQRGIKVPEELALLIERVSSALDVLDDTNINQLDFSNITAVPTELFVYWDAVASAREMYRSQITSFSGRTEVYSYTVISHIITRWLNQLDQGIQRATIIGSFNFNTSDNNLGIPPTYFSYNVTKWRVTGKNNEGHYFVNATEMAVNRFPLFLEGPVRSMKTISTEDAEQIYIKVKTSTLYDNELGMYTLSSR